MEFPTDNFTFVKLKKAYKQREKITETGIYYHSIDKCFDLVHVRFNHQGEIRERSIVTRIPEHVTFEDPVKMYQRAVQQLSAFDGRTRNVAVQKQKEAVL